jgi:hypothetical protein
LSSANWPGGRSYTSSWYNPAINGLYIFGGEGFDSQNTIGLLNDLWIFLPLDNNTLPVTTGQLTTTGYSTTSTTETISTSTSVSTTGTEHSNSEKETNSVNITFIAIGIVIVIGITLIVTIICIYRRRQGHFSREDLEMTSPQQNLQLEENPNQFTILAEDEDSIESDEEKQLTLNNEQIESKSNIIKSLLTKENPYTSLQSALQSDE